MPGIARITHPKGVKTTYFILLLPSKAFSEIYCEFYDKYYIRKHLVTTCQLGDCAQLEKLTMMRPTVGQSGGEEVDKSWWKLRNWKIEVIQRIKLNEMYNSINQAFSSYYRMRSILNRKDFMWNVTFGLHRPQRAWPWPHWNILKEPCVIFCKKIDCNILKDCSYFIGGYISSRHTGHSNWSLKNMFVWKRVSNTQNMSQQASQTPKNVSKSVSNTWKCLKKASQTPWKCLKKGLKHPENVPTP